MSRTEAPELADETVRVPPHSREAEQSVLGGLLLDNLAWTKVAGRLTAPDFFDDDNRLIFEAIDSLLNAGQSADVVTVFEELQRLGKADRAGGLVYLNALAQSVPGSSNMHQYAEIVRERGTRRKLIACCDAVTSAAFAPGRTRAAELVECAMADLLALPGPAAASASRTMEELALGLMNRVVELSEGGGSDLKGMSTGLADLDRRTGGLPLGDLIVLAARPSMGKTALALNIAEAAAIGACLPVVVFSLEMSAESLFMRLAAAHGRIDSSRLQTGRMTDDEWGRLVEVVERLKYAPILIEDATASLGAILALARRHAARHGRLGLIVIDYLQLIAGSGGRDNRATELGAISRSLKALAKDLQCPVLALSQLNRCVESRTDKRPMMSDLRESGAIEQDADAVLFIYRDDYYTKDASKEPGVAEIIVSKNRNGPVGVAKALFQGAIVRFDNLAH